MPVREGEILAAINSTDDLRRLDVKDLPKLCDEIRQYIIDVVSHNPGHLGASLGTVELTVAIHYVYNTPDDKLIWDVGHQSYAHKILTGRKDAFWNYRRYKGISGFPRMSESEYDAFGTGHSSTSISATLGMATASYLQHEVDRRHIAVIGDGSMTAGMAFEAMNHAGVSKTNLLVVLNDNGISIDQSVGALKEYLLDVTTSKFYNRLKGNIWHIIRWKNLRRFINKILASTKLAIVKQSNLFEALNFRYFGPVDGHDVKRLVKLFRHLKEIGGPKLLHCITVKGKGFVQAEKEQTRFHSPGVFDKLTGASIESEGKDKPVKYQIVFGRTLTELATINPLIVGITPAMLSGSSLNIMQEKFPDRTFDVGIAEQHAVTFAAGLAAQGMIPFCSIYSSFMQRAYDQVIHDIALQNLSVVLCIDRGGLVGEDGATHHGAFDLAFLRCIPGLIISAPMNESELRNLMYTAQLRKSGPFVIRYPKGYGCLPQWQTEMKEMEIGKGRKLRDGSDVAILTVGTAGNLAEAACYLLEQRDISAAHYDMRFVKPLDIEILSSVAKQFQIIFTVEDGVIEGGFGSAVAEYFAENSFSTRVIRLGIPDRFVEHGSNDELFHECGYDADGIAQAISQMILTPGKEIAIK